MIAPHRDAVRRLRRRVRAAVAANATWRKQRRQLPSAWRRNLGWSQLRFLIPIGALLVAAAGMSPQRLLSIGLLWTFCVTLVRANQIADVLGSPAVLAVPFHLPVEDGLWLREQSRAIARSACWLALDWLAVATGYAYGTGLVSWLIAAPLLAWAQGTAAVALAVWAVVLLPRAPFMYVAGAGWIAIIVSAQTGEHHWLQVQVVDPLFRGLAWLTPGGWLRQSAEVAVHGNPLGWAGLLLGGAGATWAVKAGAAVLRANFSPERIFDYENEPEPDASRPAPAPASGALDEPNQAAIHAPPPLSEAGRTRLRARLATQFERPAGADLAARGWLEHVVVRTLTSRQRVVADFLRLTPLWSWSRGWLVGLVMLALARIWHAAGGDPLVTGLVTIGAWTGFVLLVFGGVWPGFNGLTIFHARIGIQSTAPAGFAEIAFTMLRVNAVRTAIGLPLVLLGARHLFVSEPLAWMEAANLALQIGAFVVMIQPIWVIAAFSKTTNDTSARWWFTLLIAGTIGLLLLGMLASGVLIAATRNDSAPWISLAVLAAATHTVLLGYGAAYRWGVFDLVSASRNS